MYNTSYATVYNIFTAFAIMNAAANPTAYAKWHDDKTFSR
jgi:hypothetical protein